jgi:radical SAM protein with 4Fe4S-binding SPASM domain
MEGTLLDFFVQLHMTERCNLRCAYCYQTGSATEMSYAEICRAIDNVKDGIEGWATDYQLDISPSLHLTGGEPLLRDDVYAVLGYAWDRGFAISLMTNGTLIESGVAWQLGEGLVSDVQVSLDGLEPVHDSLRGRGSYEKALNGIRNLVAQGVETSINVTVSAVNRPEVAELVRLAEDLEVGAIAFSRMVAAGRGAELGGSSLTREEVASLYGELRELDLRSSVSVISRDPLAIVATLGDNIPDTELPVGGCAAGLFGITIASDGTVMPCRRMNLPIGNIGETSFRELWASSPVLWALRRREGYHDGCDECLYWPVCRGCRAIALAFSRAEGREDYLGGDPQCPYQRPLQDKSRDLSAYSSRPGIPPR